MYSKHQSPTKNFRNDVARDESIISSLFPSKKALDEVSNVSWNRSNNPIQNPERKKRHIFP
jgi:hypothetical protein